MKIVFLAGTLGRGGAERQLIYMLQALRSEQIEARVLCLTKGEAFENDIRNMGIEVEWVGSSQNQFVRLAKIIRNLQKRRVDILQSSHFFTNIYAALAGRALGVHSIGAIRSDMINEIASNGVFSKLQLKLPQKLIANSQTAVDRAIARGIGPKNIDLVRNVVGKQPEGRNSDSDDAITVLFAGRLVPLKRPEIFVEMAAQLLKRLPNTNIKFTIAGDGPLRANLERLARESSLQEKQLSFLGELENMAEVYRKADMLVLTSELEGTPNVILEAMAYGLPVVATRVGGVPAVVNEKCGILVDPGNVQELIAAATRLILDGSLRANMGAHARKYVGKNHSIGYLQDRLRSIYCDLLESQTKNGESGSINK